MGVFLFVCFLLHCQYLPHWAYAAERHSKIWGFIYQTERRTSSKLCTVCKKFGSVSARPNSFTYKHAPQNAIYDQPHPFGSNICTFPLISCIILH